MYEYNEDDKKIDFSHNPFSMPQGGLDASDLIASDHADHQGVSSTTSSATATRSPRAASAITSPEPMVKAFEIAGYGEKDGGRPLRRHVSRVPVRRAAAWRHGGGRRPHRDAALRYAATCARSRCSR